MELVVSYGKELGKEISDEDFGFALYQMYRGWKSLNIDSQGAARNGQLPAMKLVLSSAKELGKEISDGYFGRALYQIYCA